MKHLICLLAGALAVSGCGAAREASPEDVLDLLEKADGRACEAALPLAAEEIRRIDFELGWEWVAEALKARSAVTGRETRFVSFDPQNRAMRCEARFDVTWLDGTEQGAAPEPGVDGYYLVPKDGGFVIRLTEPEAGAQWDRPKARVRYAAMRDHLIAESLQSEPPV